MHSICNPRKQCHPSYMASASSIARCPYVPRLLAGSHVLKVWTHYITFAVIN